MMEDEKKAGRPGFLRMSALLGVAVSGCVLLYALRVLVSGRSSYLFLVWNLFLAFIPYLFAGLGSYLASRASERKSRQLIAVVAALLWLAFYPNAPYIFTDFIHVFNRTFLRGSPSEWIGLNALIWYDIIMNSAFAFAGHFIGLVSMWLIQNCVARVWGRLAARILVAFAILLAGFGIYLGRFSRLNSWDLVLSAKQVVSETAEALSDPKAIMFSLAFSTFIFLTYASLVFFKRLDAPDPTRTTRKE
jgi:uncharacterized membrane protein